MRSPAARAIVVLTALWGALYLPHLIAGDTLPFRDLAATHAPWRCVWRDLVLAGHTPIWDPASNQGRPLLANPNTMAAYPGTLLFLILPPEAATAWHVALHHLLLLLGCFHLARRAGATDGAAAVGAAALGTAGVPWSVATFLNAQAALAWLPWAVAVVSSPPGDRRTALRCGLTAGALLGLSFLAGEPITAALGAFAVVTVVAMSWRDHRSAGLPAVLAAAVGVAAPVLVPLLAIYAETVRGVLGTPSGALAADALAPRRWIELLFANLLGPPLADRDTGFWAAASFPWQRYYPSIFLGAMPLLALPFARSARNRSWWALLVAGVGGSLAIAVPEVAATVRLLPFGSGLRFGIKLLQLAWLALVPLTAAGLESAWFAHRVAFRRIAVTTTFAALVALTVIAVSTRPLRALLATAYPASQEALATTPDADLQRAVAVDLVTLALPAVAAPFGALAPGGLAAVAFVADAVAAAEARAWDDGARWSRPPAALGRLGARSRIAAFAAAATPPDGPGGDLARFWATRAALVPNYATRWGVGYVLARGPDGLEPVREELLAAAGAHLSVADRTRVARALGADTVVADRPFDGWPATEIDGVTLVLTADSAPAAYLARRSIPAEGMVATVNALADPAFRAGSDVVVEGQGAVATLAGGELQELSGAPHHRRFEVQAPGPTLLVVRQSFMTCWQARVDGRIAPTEPVNGAQLGVRLGGGSHRIELEIDPRPYWAALPGPLLVALALAALSRRGRPSPAPAGSSGEPERTSPATPPAP